MIGGLALASFVVGFAASVKLVPAVILPVLMIAAFGRTRWRGAVRSRLSFLVGLALAFVPFLVGSPGGVLDSLRFQLQRSLQMETPGASILLVAHAVAGTGVQLVDEAQTRAIEGTGGTVAEYLTTAAFIVALVYVWWLSSRIGSTPDGLVVCVCRDDVHPRPFSVGCYPCSI